MTTITLAAIRAHKPCRESRARLLAATSPQSEVALLDILDLLGFDDCLWAFRALPEDLHPWARLVVCDLVEPALAHTSDLRPAATVRVARRYALGLVSVEQLIAAWAEAWDAAKDAARDEAWAARNAGWAAAGAAAGDAVGGAVGAAQDAAGAVARAVARAAWDAAGAVWDARALTKTARVAAWDAARADQERTLRRWLTGERTAEDVLREMERQVTQ